MAAWREGDGLAVVLAGAAAGYGGDRGRPVTGAAERGSRPATAGPPVEPWPPTAGHHGRSFLLICSRPPLLFTAWAAVWRAEGAPLKP
jgi:hypothetical protein